MADIDTVLVDIADRIATLTINRPDKLNALNEATRSRLVDLFADLASNDDVRVAVITGAG